MKRKFAHFALLLLLVTGISLPVYSQLTYCIPVATNPCTSALGNPTIGNFTLYEINNNTDCVAGSYIDFTSPITYPNIQTTLQPDSTYTYYVERTHLDIATPYAVDVWIDYNQNGSFDDAGEHVSHLAAATDCNGPGLYCYNVVESGTFTVPANVTPGTTRLRVRLVYHGTASDSACETIAYGESEDYRILFPGTNLNSITTGAITGSPLCACTTVKVPFTSAGTFIAGNSYTAQLSDSTGSFASPVTIGTNANDTLHTDTISATIPCNTATGSGYRIRVISSAPAVTGTDNGVNITINAQAEASVIISANPGNNICAGSSVTFTATPTNGGATPSYQWKVNGGNAGTNSNTFTSDTLSNGDVVTCVLTSDAPCVTGSPAPSNALTMTVTAAAPASVNITASPSGAICAGTSVLFTAKPTNGGSTPSYQWQVNSSNAGANADTFSSAALTNGAQVTCIMTSNAACVTGSPATSNTVTITVNQLTAASVNVSANTGDTICSGTPVTFTAQPQGGGTLPSYQWKLNGSNVGTNNASYSDGSLANGDYISCVMTSNASCVTGSPATSDTITMNVNSSLPASVSISAGPDSIICSGASVTFTANSAGGGTPAYQWKLNNINAGTNSSTYTPAGLNNGDRISCVMTSSLACAIGSPASSNTITMTVNQPTTVSVNVSANTGDTICTGTPVTFTAQPQGGGTTPSFQWELNGNNVGTNSDSYSDNALANGDYISCVMTSSLTCTTGSPATSDTVIMNVNTTEAASVSISANPGNSICSGTPVAFSASAQGGGIPAYQWKVNGGNVGANAPSYSDNSLVNSDVVTCVMTSSLSCATGSPATSNAVTMSVVPKAVAGTVSATQNFVCTGTLAVLNDNGASGGNYQWQSSPDSVAGFGSISGATAVNYTSAPISKSTYYRVVVANSSCADTSASYKITVSAPPSATFSASVNGKVVTFNITSNNGVTSYFWNFGDGTTDTAASPTHTYDSVTTYDVCLTVRNASDCNDFICQNVTTFPTGINEISSVTDWQVYPDPFSNQLYISSGTATGYVVSIEVYDILGRNVLLKNINGIMDNPTILDVSNLRSGVYYLRVTTLNNNFVKPVVKQ